MNALPADNSFTVRTAPDAEWLVLRCAPSQTLRLAAMLANLGAWTPTWKRMRKIPRGTIRRLTTEACLPSFLFIPTETAEAIPENTPCRPMRIEGTVVRIRDRQLDAMRQLADKPLPKARDLPKPGQVIRVTTGAFEGLDAKVVTAKQRYCSVLIAGFPQPIQMPSSLLLKNWA